MRRAQVLHQVQAKGDHLRVANLHYVNVVGKHVYQRYDLVALAVIDGKLKLHGLTS